MKTAFRLLKYIFINLLILLVLLVIIDFFLDKGKETTTNQKRNILLREWAINIDQFQEPSDSYLTKCENLEKKKYRFRTDENGFIIGDENLSEQNKPTDIIFFGGSTTECLFVEEEKRFPYLVQTNLNKLLDNNVKVLNAGVSGNHTLHSTFNLLSKGIPQSPKIVVLMHNINDLALLEKTGTYWDAPKTRAIIQTQRNNCSKSNKIESLKNALIPNIYNFFVAKLNNITKKDEWEGYRNQKKIPFLDIENQFEKSITTFIDISKKHGYKVILMTQFNRINLQDVFILQNANDKEHYTEFVDMYHKLNEKIREIAEKKDVGLIDLSEKVPSNKKYIYDEVHLNTYGSEFVADIITEYLLNNYYK